MTLSVVNLKKHYGSNLVVNQVSFEAKSGKAFGLLGGNGAGKTTIIRSILGLLQYESGEVLWGGNNFNKKPPKVGYLPEERGLYPKNKVTEQLLYFARLEGMKKIEALQAISYWLEKFHISNYANKKVEELSKGNQQKVQIISSLIHNPQLIIFDEPFSGLDPVNSEVLAQIVKEQLTEGKTMIFSSHQMNQVESFCDEICILKKGETVLSGNLNEIKKNSDIKEVVIKSYHDLMPFINERNLKYVKSSEYEWRVRVSSREEAFEIFNHLAKQNIEILKFECSEPTLHEIFINKVGIS